MRTADEVAKLIDKWKSEGRTKPEIITMTSEATLGWPYVWGAAGQYCTAAYRKQFANRSSCPEGESKLILSQCQVCNGKKSFCDGCKWYPGGKVRIFDCRGFTRWVMARVDITIAGAGATSQWNTASNWAAKGDIDTVPNQVCVLFWKDKKKAGVMAHTGLYLGNGQIIHCSGTVKRDTLSTKGWTDWAVPKGLEGDTPYPETKPTIKKGSTGPYVVECQNDLITLGYDLSPYGADGKFGTKTETAVKAFQKASRLTADGIVGSKTWAALDAAVGPEPDPEPTHEPLLFTVTIPHLTGEQAADLRKKYPDAKAEEERG